MEPGGIADIVPGGHVEKRMTIMFCDIRDFTAHTERMSPHDAIGFVNSFMGIMEPVIHKGGGVIDKFIGDAVMAVFPGTPDEGVAAAVSMVSALDNLNLTRGTGARRLIRAGIGLNTGMAMIGAVGDLERMEPTVISGAVNLASRFESATKNYGAAIIVSENTCFGLKEPLRRKIRFLDRVRVKGKSEPQSIYEVFDGDPAVEAAAKERTKARFEEAAAYYHLKAVGRAKKLFAECLEAAPGDKPARFYLERCALFERTGRHDGTGEFDGKLDWRTEFEVGVKMIDLQHKELLANMNKLPGLIREGDTSRLEGLCGFLADYAGYHFSYEESLMRLSGYPFFEDHKAEHRRFAAYLERFTGEVTSGTQERLFLLFKVQVFLFDWFACHSTGMDRHLGIYLRDPGRAGALPKSESVVPV